MPPRPGPARPGPCWWPSTHASLYRHFWRASIVTTVISPILYLLAMGLGVGTLVDANAGGAVDADRLGGLPYLHYVAPGLLASTAMQTAVNGSMYPVLASVKWLRTAFGIAASPIRPTDMALGLQLWLAAQLLLSSSVFAAVITAAGAVSSPWVLAAPPVAALGGLAYSAPMAAWAIGRESEHSFTLILRLGILPSFLLSGTFFPVQQLPDVIEVLAVVSPLWHTVELVRSLASGAVAVGPAAGHLAVLAGYAGVGLAVGRGQYSRRLRQ